MEIKRLLYLAMVLLSLLPVTLSAQDYDSRRLAAMEKLAFLEGEWRGETWTRTREGERLEGRVVERVERRLDGAILTLEGRGAAGDPDAPGADLTHHAFAVVFFDPDAGEYRMHSYKDGRFLDAALSVTGNEALQWGFDVPDGGRVRFSIRLDEQGRWSEEGHYSPDGETWLPFFGMTLERVDE